jgi:photosystem II stability/assembly factor-like uncharacterized protein
MFLTTHAGGLAITEDAGATWNAFNLGLNNATIDQLFIPPWSGGGNDELLVVGGPSLWESLDAGRHWREHSTPMGRLGPVMLLTNPDRIWLLGGIPQDPEGGDFVHESLDYGETWTSLTFAGLEAELDVSQQPAHGVQLAIDDGTPVICLLIQDRPTIVCSEDNGDNWVVRYSDHEEGVATPLIGWPPAAPERILFGSRLGILASDDSGRTWTTLYEDTEGGFIEMASADNGYLFAANPAGEIFRSEDGGETWINLGVRSPAVVYAIQPRPRFKDDGDEVILSTHAGPYIIQRASRADAELRPFSGYQRVEDSSAWFRCTTDICPQPTSSADASSGTMQQIQPGSAFEIFVRGHTIQIIGVSDAVGNVEMIIDGGAAMPIGREPYKRPTIMSTVTGLTDEMHSVLLRGLTDNGVYIDAVIGLSEHTPLRFTGGGDTGDTALDSGDHDSDGGDGGHDSGGGAPDGGAGGDGGDGGPDPSGAVPLTDAGNYNYTGTLDGPSFIMAELGDPVIDWSAVQTDIQCHAIDPVKDIDNVQLLVFPYLTEAEVELGLAEDSIEQVDLGVYLSIEPGDRTSVNLSEFTFFGTDADIEEVFEEGRGTWMVSFATGFDVGIGTRSLAFLEPSSAGTETTASLPADGCSVLDFDADLESLTPTQVLTDGPWLLDWSALTRNGQGGEFEHGDIDEILVGRYEGVTAAELQGQFLDLELIAADLWTLELIGGSEADLSEIEGFTSFSGEGLWVLALRCSTCPNPAPLFLTLLEPR